MLTRKRTIDKISQQNNMSATGQSFERQASLVTEGTINTAPEETASIPETIVTQDDEVLAVASQETVVTQDDEALTAASQQTIPLQDDEFSEILSQETVATIFNEHDKVPAVLPQEVTHENLVEALIAKVERTPSHKTVVVESSQDYLTLNTQEIEQVCDVIEHKRPKSLRFTSRAMVTCNGAGVVFNKFLDHPTINNLDFPIYGAVNSPGQGPLMHMHEDFSYRLEAHNSYIERNNKLTFSCFKDLNQKKCLVERPGTPRPGLATPINVPSDGALELIKELAASKPKKADFHM